MLEVILFQPEIPPNTGNAIRLCANTGTRLHLVAPLGFDIDEKTVRRAGMDYAELASVTVHDDWAACQRHFAGRVLYAMTTRATRRYDTVSFQGNEVFVFGPETRGLPETLLAEFPDERRLRLPMMPGNRSVNLSNAVAVTVFEAWRQLGFPGHV